MCDTASDYISQLNAALEGVVLPAIIRRLEQAVEPLLYLMPTQADTDAPGTTRVGGLPDLPPGMDWPRMIPLTDGEAMPAPWDDWDSAEAIRLRDAQRPYTFLAQIDLADVSGFAPADTMLPDEGRLLFFYSFETFDPGQWVGRVIWDRTPPAALTRATLPPELEAIHAAELAERRRLDEKFGRDPDEYGDPNASRALFPATALDPLQGYGLPQFGALAFATTGLEAIVNEDMDGMIEAAIHQAEDACLDPDLTPYARLAGGIRPEQDDPRFTAARMTGTATDDWSFLFQIDLEYASGGAFWEGAVYFLIPTEDLYQRRFDRVHVEFQQT